MRRSVSTPGKRLCSPLSMATVLIAVFLLTTSYYFFTTTSHTHSASLNHCYISVFTLLFAIIGAAFYMINQAREHMRMLNRSVIYLQGMLDTFPTGLAAVDKTGHLLAYNKGFLTCWGFAAETIRAKDVSKLINKQLTAPAQLSLSSAAAAPIKLVCKNGRILLSRTQPLALNDYPGALMWTFEPEQA